MTSIHHEQEAGKYEHSSSSQASSQDVKEFLSGLGGVRGPELLLNNPEGRALSSILPDDLSSQQSTSNVDDDERISEALEVLQPAEDSEYMTASEMVSADGIDRGQGRPLSGTDAQQMEAADPGAGEDETSTGLLSSVAMKADEAQVDDIKADIPVGPKLAEASPPKDGSELYSDDSAFDSGSKALDISTPKSASRNRQQENRSDAISLTNSDLDESRVDTDNRPDLSSVGDLSSALPGDAASASRKNSYNSKSSDFESDPDAAKNDISEPPSDLESSNGDLSSVSGSRIPHGQELITEDNGEDVSNRISDLVGNRAASLSVRRASASASEISEDLSAVWAITDAELGQTRTYSGGDVQEQDQDLSSIDLLAEAFRPEPIEDVAGHVDYSSKADFEAIPSTLSRTTDSKAADLNSLDEATSNLLHIEPAGLALGSESHPSIPLAITDARGSPSVKVLDNDDNVVPTSPPGTHDYTSEFSSFASQADEDGVDRTQLSDSSDPFSSSSSDDSGSDADSEGSWNMRIDDEIMHHETTATALYTRLHTLVVKTQTMRSPPSPPPPDRGTVTTALQPALSALCQRLHRNASKPGMVAVPFREPPPPPPVPAAWIRRVKWGNVVARMEAQGDEPETEEAVAERRREVARGALREHDVRLRAAVARVRGKDPGRDQMSRPTAWDMIADIAAGMPKRDQDVWELLKERETRRHVAA
ncbi:hypothetical protein HKX48_002529 [Thoreauomyces humboldtii]|nr:hypothetical protein HKX48_002529 [Thoreauomyces humboldtii]